MRPLEGTKILDLSHALAGPFCTYHLQLLGAEVIKVERPELGDDFRHYVEHSGPPTLSAPFVAANAGKRSITIDLKSPAGLEIVQKLIEQSDVLVENFRPGVPAKLGLDWENVKPLNERLIYCSISGFGQTGELRDWAAYDHIIQAMSGLTLLNGEPDQGPLKVGSPIVLPVTSRLMRFWQPCYSARIPVLANTLMSPCWMRPWCWRRTPLPVF